MRIFTLTVALISVCLNCNADELQYNRDIQPILSENCFFCHGQDPAHREADLRLDSSEEALKDLGDYAAIVPGKPDASEMVKRVLSSDPDVQMPPPDSNRHLSPDQIELLRKWINQGAVYQPHWAYIPPVRSELPEVKASSWVKQPIDQFVLRRLESESLSPSPETSPATWLRRASFDLVGLPPTPNEIHAFEADVTSMGEAAYAEAVDRLLASPHFGERMAVDWLDASRYADTHGFNNDSTRTMWRWRDWVIDAFNENMPYDQFITEQLAGDLLPNPTLEQRIATGFSRNHVINSEGGIIDEEYRVEYVADRVRTMSTAWLGLTTECARCHDHKFDAIKQRDYYQFFAFFNNIAEFGEDGRVANAVPMIKAPTRQQQAELRQQRIELDTLDAKIAIARNAIKPQDVEIRGRELYPSSEEGFINMLDVPDAGDELLGNGIRLRKDEPNSQIKTKKLEFNKNKTATLSLWIKPDEQNDRDVAILSSIDYNGSTADAQYGKGRELRLVDGEIEWRESSRLSVYARIVRSSGAAIKPGQWHQVVVTVVEGRSAATVRIFIDGEEIQTEAIYDGYVDAPPDREMILGGDNAKDSPVFVGEIDELKFAQRAMNSESIRLQFFCKAIPLALAQPNSALYQDWILRWSMLPSDLQQQRSKLWERHLLLQRSLPTSMVMQELPKPRESFVLLRGNYDAHGDRVYPAALESLLAPWPENAPRNRLGLAQWFTQPNHPLTARVVVNRFWAECFGVGIVKTVEDFGAQSEWPSHPEVLDLLSRDFIDGGWNVKALLKSIVLSATYRQSSHVTSDLYSRDPENRLLARGPRVRLKAELMRDQALTVSGLLKTKIGGPSVFPYQPSKLYESIVVGADYPGSKWEQSEGDDLYRRSLYTFLKRTVPHPSMLTFDAPDREVCTVRRSRTNTPLQALLLWNEQGYLEAAMQLAKRMMAEGGVDDVARVSFAFELATGRIPTESEVGVLVKTLNSLQSDFSQRPEAAAAFIKAGGESDTTREAVGYNAAMMAIANMILNLDETITKN